MMMTQLKRLLSVILCIVLIAAALFATGCSDKTENDGENPVDQTAEQTGGDEEPDETSQETPVSDDDVKELGEGEKKFDFVVVDLEGNETKFVIKTDKTTVGDALLDVELIAGGDSQYGLYVTTVNGITADYDVDGTYWGFYIDGEYAMTGVDSTNIEEGKTYSFKVSK